MARPQIDQEAVREQLFLAAEEFLRSNGPVTFSISDLAMACGMSQSNFYRYFESKEAFYEAMAGRWFEELNTVMEEVVAADLPPRDKLFAFFARRLAIKRARYAEDPDLFDTYVEIGEEHWEVIRGYIDLADHYMAQILGEAMTKGHFAGFELDHLVALVNLMVQPFCSPKVMVWMARTAQEANLAIVIDTIFAGLRRAESDAVDGTDRGEAGQVTPLSASHLYIAS